MRKKTSSSLPTFSDGKLVPLHRAIESFTGPMATWSVESERARQRAFAVRSNAKLFKYWYLRSQVLKRFQGSGYDPVARREAALDVFEQLELQAGQANARLVDGWARPISEAVRKQLVAARKLIYGVLGPFRLDTLPRHCDFSSGATTEQPRTRSSAAIKWEEATHVTRSALPYAIAFVRWAGLDQPVSWFGDDGVVYQTSRGHVPNFRIVDGNTVFTVPKRFDVDRTCAKEPPWNVFLQKGLGSMIRERLNHVGLLHPDAQDYHARLARDASYGDVQATVDMKGASETVTVALIELLFPPEWAQVILDLRSPRGQVPGRGSVTYEKVSSMGNGATFELETLVFWALARACCRDGEVVSVYGDDLICPSVRVSDIRRLFQFCGFEFNQEKSFVTGPFRESCGGHFWRGVDVKPFYIERLPTSLLQVINLHNDIVRWMQDGPIIHRLVEICRLCRSIVPREFWGPMGEDGCLWAEWDEALPRFVRGGNRKKQVSYNHWRVSTVRREVVTQRHDYFRGSLFAAYWSYERSNLGRPHHTLPWWSARRQVFSDVPSLAQSLRACEESAVSLANFTYALTREVKGWRSVGVASDWPRLPVRLA